jgi:hypothetical protein
MEGNWRQVKVAVHSRQFLYSSPKEAQKQGNAVYE